jgi:hypothetical protein
MSPIDVCSNGNRPGLSRANVGHYSLARRGQSASGSAVLCHAAGRRLSAALCTAASALTHWRARRCGRFQYPARIGSHCLVDFHRSRWWRQRQSFFFSIIVIICVIFSRVVCIVISSISTRLWHRERIAAHLFVWHWRRCQYWQRICFVIVIVSSVIVYIILGLESQWCERSHYRHEQTIAAWHLGTRAHQQQ